MLLLDSDTQSCSHRRETFIHLDMDAGMWIFWWGCLWIQLVLLATARTFPRSSRSPRRWRRSMVTLCRGLLPGGISALFLTRRIRCTTGETGSTLFLGTATIRTMICRIWMSILSIFLKSRISRSRRWRAASPTRLRSWITGDSMDGAPISLGRWGSSPKLAWRCMRLWTLLLRLLGKGIRNSRLPILISVILLFCSNWKTMIFGGREWRLPINPKSYNSTELKPSSSRQAKNPWQS